MVNSDTEQLQIPETEMSIGATDDANFTSEIDCSEYLSMGKNCTFTLLKYNNKIFPNLEEITSSGISDIESFVRFYLEGIFLPCIGGIGILGNCILFNPFFYYIWSFNFKLPLPPSLHLVSSQFS